MEKNTGLMLVLQRQEIERLKEELRVLKAQLVIMPQYDALTGLPNKTLFDDRLAQGMARARRNQRLMAVMYLDIDNIKRVMSMYGQAACDDLVRDFATRFRLSVREVDTLARVGPDTFAVVMEEVKKPREVAGIIRKIMANVGKGFVVVGHELNVTCSIGIAYYDGGDESVQYVIDAAKLALQQAKIAGRNTYVIADSLAGVR